jgi:hypothetical protein
MPIKATFLVLMMALAFPSMRTVAQQNSKFGTIQSTLQELYASISGDAGQPRDQARFEAIFWPSAQLTAVGKDSLGAWQLRYMSLQQFFQAMQSFTSKQGFFELQQNAKVEQWDHMAHVWSTYKSRRESAGPPFAAGINSIQLFHDGSRWWVVNIYWQQEYPESPIPKAYLPKRKNKK